MFGQPEINLHLLPGYGGTQRLPRRLYARRGPEGLADAFRLIVTRPVDRDGGGPAHRPRRRGRRRSRRPARGPRGGRRAGQAVRPRRGAAVGGLARTASAPGRERSRCQPAQRCSTAGSRSRSRPRHARVGVATRWPASSTRCARASPAAPRRVRTGRPSCLPRPLRSRIGTDGHPRLPREAQRPAAGAAHAGPAAGRRPRHARDSRPTASCWRSTPASSRASRRCPPTSTRRRSSRTRPPAGRRTATPTVAEQLVVVPVPHLARTRRSSTCSCPRSTTTTSGPSRASRCRPSTRVTSTYHITGSGGVGLVASLGSELKREGRVAVGDLVTVYSGQSELLSPDMGLDPMAADFRIQGYERADGSHAQFLLVQGPQLHPKLPDLTFEEAGSYGLNTGTIARCLFTTLSMEPGRRLFVEGAATGTGMECLKIARQSGVEVSGMVSSAERGARVRDHGGHPVDRTDPRWAKAFTLVPDDPAEVAAWLAAGEAFVSDVWSAVGGPIDLLGVARRRSSRSRARSSCSAPAACWRSSARPPATASRSSARRARPRPRRCCGGQACARAARCWSTYGPGARDGIVDPVAIEAIEAARALGARAVALTDTNAQRELLLSLGFGDALAGAGLDRGLSATARRRVRRRRDLPALCRTRKADGVAFKEVIRLFNDRTLKPIGAAIGPYLRTQADRARPARLRLRTRGPRRALADDRARQAHGRPCRLLGEPRGAALHVLRAAGVDAPAAHPHAQRRDPWHAPQHRARVRRDERADRGGAAAGDAAGAVSLDRHRDGAPGDVGEPACGRHLRRRARAAAARPQEPRGLYRAWALRDAAARGEKVERIDTGRRRRCDEPTRPRPSQTRAACTGGGSSSRAPAANSAATSRGPCCGMGRSWPRRATTGSARRARRGTRRGGVLAGQFLAVVGDPSIPTAAGEWPTEAAAHFGAIDVLVNHAETARAQATARAHPVHARRHRPSRPRPGRPWPTGPAPGRAARPSGQTMFDVAMALLGGPWHMTRATLPHFAAAGAIVNVSTVFARMPCYGRIPYVVPKAALNALSLGLARELGRSERGLRVNTLLLGPVESDQIHAAFEQMDRLKGSDPGTTAKSFLETMQLRRFGAAADRAAVRVPTAGGRRLDAPMAGLGGRRRLRRPDPRGHPRHGGPGGEPGRPGVVAGHAGGRPERPRGADVGRRGHRRGPGVRQCASGSRRPGRAGLQAARGPRARAPAGRRTRAAAAAPAAHRPAEARVGVTRLAVPRGPLWPARCRARPPDGSPRRVGAVAGGRAGRRDPALRGG